MRRKIILLWFISVCFAGSLSGQQVDKQQKQRFVVVPAEQVLVTIAYQPGCPLQFEEVKYLAGVNGGRTPSFLIRNKSTKQIRSFTVGGPDWTMTWSEEFTKKLLMPGERAFDGDDDDFEIVPLSSELRDKLQLKDSMRSVLVLMVIRVEYADGSAFSAESTYRALQKYTEKLIELKVNMQ